VKDGRPRMGAAEEDLLFARAARGDRRAKERLVIAHAGSVAAAARRYARRSGQSYDDLYDEGMVGLLVAIERFDRSRPTRLITYATYWIEGQMKRLIVAPVREELYPDMDVLSAPDSDDEDEESGDHLGDEQVPPTSLDDDGAAGSTRSHKKSKEPQGKEARATDGRSVALAAVVAHAVEYGSLGEQLHYAKLASRQIRPHLGPGFSEIREFRRSHLLDGLISPEDVGAWIERHLADEGPAAAGYLRAPLGETDIGDFGELPMSQSREAYARWLEGRAQRVRTDPTAELPFGYAEGARRLSYSVPGDSRPHLARIRGDGLLAELHAIVRNLCGHFDAWTFEDAVSFIVSGAIPPLAEVRASTRSSYLYPAASRVFMDIDPRASFAEVSAWYGRLRQRHDVTRQQQPMSPRNLALAVFVECNWHPGVTWAQLLAVWNVAHPEGDELHSKQDWRQFKVDCQRAWQALTGALWPGGPNAAKRLRSQIARAHAKRRAAQL
jgi:RNA polymerase sigma factor (sigma-70 family)